VRSAPILYPDIKSHKLVHYVHAHPFRLDCFWAKKLKTDKYPTVNALISRLFIVKFLCLKISRFFSMIFRTLPIKVEIYEVWWFR